MNSKRAIVVPFFLTVFNFSGLTQENVQAENYLRLSWKEVATKMPDQWYGSNASRIAADSVLKYQTIIGGWPKNLNFHRGVDQKEWAQIKSTGIGATIDNGATTTEMMFLAKMYGKTKDRRYAEAFNKGLTYLLQAQYPNGGWPQFFPIRPGRGVAYNSHITYNDNAMVNVLWLLKDIVEDSPSFAGLPIDKEMKKKAQQAFEKGIACILKTQIAKNGELQVWCAQHDEVTLAPANARAFELASYSGQESAGIVLLLMEINNPSAEIKNAVSSAVRWFNNHAIPGIRLETFTNSEGKKDKRVVDDTNATVFWARFYDLDTEQPFFCDRDGIKRKTFGELGYERRNGYAWYTDAPADVLKNYTKWANKWAINK